MFDKLRNKTKLSKRKFAHEGGISSQLFLHWEKQKDIKLLTALVNWQKLLKMGDAEFWRLIKRNLKE